MHDLDNFDVISTVHGMTPKENSCLTKHQTVTFCSVLEIL